ncbi:hypothetical protein T08_15737 [Trichinella sp. T8]|nr:hypothetical protein T08_15737 [Trichinella sp. T8]
MPTQCARMLSNLIRSISMIKPNWDSCFPGTNKRWHQKALITTRTNARNIQKPTLLEGLDDGWRIPLGHLQLTPSATGSNASGSKLIFNASMPTTASIVAGFIGSLILFDRTSTNSERHQKKRRTCFMEQIQYLLMFVMPHLERIDVILTNDRVQSKKNTKKVQLR